MNQRPDLYAAMVIRVPLLDMQRYTRLGACASWVAECGDPDTDDWSYMSKWSPYQNMRGNVAYPPSRVSDLARIHLFRKEADGERE